MAQNYTPEEHAAAWAAYYAQQGYDAHTIAAMTAQSQPEASSSSSAGYGGQAQYGAAPANARIPAGTQLLDQDLLQQSSVYLPGATEKLVKEGKYKPPPGKRQTVVRKGGGKTWEDTSLLEWDPKWFRLFVGDVSNDVNERTLDAAFNKYPSFCKCKVVRDRLSEKAKYGFIAFTDPEDFLKAWKEMDGKYVGNRPIKLSKVKDEVYGSIDTVTVSGKKAKQLDKLRKNRGKPLDGRPVPF